jgi:flagellar L-ring protein precursor FlgH
MTSPLFRLPLLSVLLGGLTLGGCGTLDRLSEVGQPPELAPIENPVEKKDYQPVVLPMPQQGMTMPQSSSSLWRAGARSFFKDQRAGKTGDIVTVEINITDSATVNNSTSRSRTSAEDSDLSTILGFQSQLDNILPDEVDPTNLTSFGSTSSTQGVGSIDRSESVTLTVAAIITQVLPNGNLVIMGRQEVRVNYELRELIITGIVRPEDITNQNTIAHTQIAEARIAYGGRGHISEMQKPRWGQEIYEVLFPF